MYKKDVIDHFGTQRAVAKALGISDAAVSQWKEPVKQLPVMGGRPLNRAQALAKIAEIKAKFGLKGASV
ncbi:TPA: Cro/CI family transcriptional regulator [Escherichia coli]